MMQKTNLSIYFALGVILGGSFYLIYRNEIVASCIVAGTNLLGFLVKYNFRNPNIEPLDFDKAFSTVTPREISSFSGFMCEIAGADPIIIAKFFPSELFKYFTIGLSVVFTGFLATFSGGYAIFKIFDNIFFAVLIGLLWGLIIMNIDRIMIISISKVQSMTQQLLRTIPRIILATVIAVVISRPIEIRMFENRLNADLAKLEETINKSNIELARSNSRVNEFSDGRNSAIDEIADIESRSAEVPTSMTTRKDQLNRNISRAQSNINVLSPQVNEFRNRLSDTINPLSESELQEFNQLNKELNYEVKQRNIFQNELVAVQNSIDNIVNEFEAQKRTDLQAANQRKKYFDEQFLEADRTLTKREGDIMEASSTSISKGDFMVMLELFEDKKDEDDSIFWISTFITFLFICIETMPIIAKLFSPVGGYDFYLEALKKNAKKYADK